MKNRPIRHRIEYGLYLTLKGLLRALPHETARRLGRGVGALGHALDRRHREVALRNLEMAIPEIPPDERRRLVRECFRHFGAALCDVISAGRFDAREICVRLSLEGWENVHAAARPGKGFFVLSPHLGMWEMVPPVIGLYHAPMHIIMRPADNPYLNRELQSSREQFGNRTIPKRGAARRMLETLREGGIVGILIDQRVQAKEGIEVPFFGRPALTTPVLARVSLRTGAPVLPVAMFPEPHGRYRLVVHPPIFPSADGGQVEEAVVALTRRYLEVAEQDIRRHPEQWLWMHRRWEARK
ncbi:MAG: lysophospholipid acyltransferase family protein [Thermoanaerobaculia bacterium]